MSAACSNAGRGKTAAEDPLASGETDSSVKRIGSSGELYAHALLFGRETVERCHELALLMVQRDNDLVAAVLIGLERRESEHVFRLMRKTAGITLPKLASGEPAGLDKKTLLRADRWLAGRTALEIVLRAKQCSCHFFHKILAEAGDAEILEVARDMADEEEAQIAWLNKAMARAPHRPGADLPVGPERAGPAQ